MNLKSNVLASAAIAAALDYAGVEYNDAYCTFICQNDELYIVAFRTDYLKYECYMDAESLDVLGFIFEPIPDIECTEYRTDGVLWEPCGDVLAVNN